MRFNGINQASQIIGQFNDAEDRAYSDHERKARMKASTMLNEADTPEEGMRRASKYLASQGLGADAMELQTGARDWSREAEDYDNTRVERNRASINFENAQTDRKESRAADKAYAEAMVDVAPEGSASKALYEAGHGAKGDQVYNNEQQIKTNQNAENVKMAQGIFEAYVDAVKSGPDQAKALIDEIRNNPDMMKTASPEVARMLQDGDPSNDQQAAIMWIEQNGGSSATLRTWQKEEKDRKSAEYIARVKAEADVAKAEAKARGESEGENSFYSPHLRGVSPSVLNFALKQDGEAFEEAQASVDHASVVRGIADDFMASLDRHNVDDSTLGAGIMPSAKRLYDPRTYQAQWDAGGYTEKLVSEFKKPGTGVFTDDDARRAQKAVLSMKKSREDIDAMYGQIKLMETRANDYQRFLNQWVEDFGAGSIGGRSGDRKRAQVRWNRYMKEVPFYTTDDSGEVIANPGYKDYDTWASGAKWNDFGMLLNEEQQAEVDAMLDEGVSPDEIMDEVGYVW